VYTWNQIGKWLVALGIGIAILGSLLLAGSRLGSRVPWLGRLPGDIHVERKGFSCYFPLASGLVLSILLTIVLNLLIALFKR